MQAEQLWESPFTTIHIEGVTGVFEDEQRVDKLLKIIDEINLKEPETDLAE